MVSACQLFPRLIAHVTILYCIRFINQLNDIFKEKANEISDDDKFALEVGIDTFNVIAAISITTTER